MRRILIISEDDAAGNRLNQLYQSLYGVSKKELYWCSIDIIDCRQEAVLYPHKLKISSAGSSSPQNFESYISVNKVATKVIKAVNCQDIITLINEHKIDTVIIPIFIYDDHRQNQYKIIAKDIKRNSRVEIIGLYI